MLRTTLLSFLLVGCGATSVAPIRTVSLASTEFTLTGEDIAFLDDWSETLGFRLGAPRSISFVPGEDAIIYLRSGARSTVQSLYELDLSTGDERELLTAESVLRGGEEEFSQEELDLRERLRSRVRGISSYQMTEDGTRILVPLAGALFAVDRAAGTSRSIASGDPYNNAPKLSPDGTRVAVVRDREVWVISAEQPTEEVQLTHSASEHITNGLPDFIAQEEMRRFAGFWWSPEGGLIAYQQTDDSAVERLTRLDPIDPSNESRMAAFPRAGTDNPIVRLGVLSSAGGETTWIEWDQERYPYLATVEWADERTLSMVVQDRAQHEIALLGANPQTGETWTILEERDDAWINLDQQMPHWMDDGARFLWTSEREGAWQLEVRAADGSLERVLVGPELGYSSLVHADDEEVWVRTQAEPTESHVSRVPRSGGALEPMTEAAGWHGAQVSDEGVWIHSAGLADGTQIRDVIQPDGSRQAIPTQALAAPLTINQEVRSVGEREFRVSIVRPTGFDSDARYPVIVSVYGGPMAQTVRNNPRGYLYQQWLANHGFVVVSFDGRGTPARGREWERASDGRFVQIALEDQARALEDLLAELPQLDPDRVGVMGWSFGGTMAAVMTMRRPDLYRAGISGAPVTEWRDYDTHYTERYLGNPDEDPDAYDSNNVGPHAGELSRPLLLIHGAMDDNVYFSHSVQLFDALLRAGAPVEFIPLFGASHMVADRELSGALQARYLRFFTEHLRP